MSRFPPKILGDRCGRGNGAGAADFDGDLCQCSYDSTRDGGRPKMASLHFYKHSGRRIIPFRE